MRETRITWHHAEDLAPPHRVTRPEQVVELVADMRKRGWVGAPLIGYELPRAIELHDEPGVKRVQLLSGTHRRASCRELRRPVPVKVYPYSLITRCWGRLNRWTALMRGRL